MPKMPKSPETFTQEEWENFEWEGRMMGKPLWTDADLEEMRRKEGIDGTKVTRNGKENARQR